MVWTCEADLINGDTYVCASQILLSISFKQKVTGMGDGLQIARVWGEGFKSNSWLGVFAHVVQRGARRD